MIRNEIIIGDALETLRNLESESVHCIVTSPPYFGLRDYGQEGQMGNEDSPEDFVRGMVALFAEARRVLRDDGCLFLNIGDSYASNGTYLHSWMSKEHNKGKEHFHTKNAERYEDRKAVRGGEYQIKGKDLIGIPWRLALAMQADGWYLRNDFIWDKGGSSMPESVRDRATRNHEYIFHLSKKPRYYWDIDAVRLPPAASSVARVSQKSFHEQTGGEKDYGPDSNRSSRKTLENFAKSINHGCNMRTVLPVSTTSFSGAHFAVMPDGIVEPFVKAATSEGGCCATCGAPRKRIVEKMDPDMKHLRSAGADRNGEYHGKAQKQYEGTGAQDASDVKRRVLEGMRPRRTLAWMPSCECGDPETEPAIVMDPFMGSGTVAMIAKSLGRDYLGIELNPEYAALAKERVLYGKGLSKAKKEESAGQGMLFGNLVDREK